MEQTIFQSLEKITGIVAVVLIIYWIVKPLLERFFNKDIYSRINEIENNHLQTINSKIEDLEVRIYRIEERLMELEKEVGYLKGKINQAK